MAYLRAAARTAYAERRYARFGVRLGLINEMTQLSHCSSRLQASIGYVVQCMSMRSGNARYSA
jgi:hypothetical protein